MISCGQSEISVNGLEMSFGKNFDGMLLQDGNIVALALIIPNIIILIMLFCTRKKSDKFRTLFKNLFIILPIFNISAAITIIILARIMFDSSVAGYINIGMPADLINMRISYGFILYILLNIALLVLASINYFIDIKREINQQPETKQDST